MTSRIASVHKIGLMATFFIFGLQFTNLKQLFRKKYSYYNDSNEDYLGWVPEISRAMIKFSQNELSDNSVSNENTDVAEDEDDQTERRRKKSRSFPRFNAMNYSKSFIPLSWSLPEPSPLLNLTSTEFMALYSAAKRRANIIMPWDRMNNSDSVKLPLPIISLNFPKSATLAMKEFFNCGGFTSIHTSTQHGRIGICMMENAVNDNPPLENCNTHKSHGETKEIDFISDIGLQGPPCYYSSLHDGGLESIAKHYPNSTLLLVTRNATNWHKSISKWGTLLRRWKKTCKFDGSHFGKRLNYWNSMFQLKDEDEYWVNFYKAHTQKIREFAMRHLSMTYIEFQLEDQNFGNLLEYYTGISSTCLLDCHPGPKWYLRTNATSKCHPPGDLGTQETASISQNDNDDNSEGYDQDAS